MKKLRIGFFGDGPWAHTSLIKLIEDNLFEIAFVVGRYSKADEVLQEIAQSGGVPFFMHKNINSEEFIRSINLYSCDLMVSMSFNQIFKSQILQSTKLGVINCHAGKLPFYRGRNVLNWVLINDEKEFGITTHYIDERIDTGDIILQRSFPIEDSDDYATLLSRAYVECPEILYESIKLILENRVRRVPQSQINEFGSYFPKRRDGDEILNWNQDSREIFNFVRAICSPGPQARSFLGSTEIKIGKVRYIDKAPIYRGTPGSVIAVGNDFFDVKTRDSFVRVVSWSPELRIRIGDRFN